MKTAKWKLEVTVQFVKTMLKKSIFISTDRSYSKSVFISWYGSLLSLNPLVSFHAAGFSLYTGIKATQNINAVSLVILLDLQARLFERERNLCEIFFTQEMTRLCQSVLFFCLSFSTSFLQQRRQPTTLFQALQCCSSFFFFFSWWFLTSVTQSLCLFSVCFPGSLSRPLISNIFSSWLFCFPHFLPALYFFHCCIPPPSTNLQSGCRYN